MAASMARCFLAPEASKFVSRLGLSSRCYRHVRNCSSANATETNETVSEQETDQADVDELTRLRDVSRLSVRLKKQFMETAPPIDKDYQLTQNYSRRLYGKFGIASGVNPQILWPTEEKLQDIIDKENEFDRTFEMHKEQMRTRKEKRERRNMETVKKVEVAMAKMPKILKEFRSNIENVEKETAAHKAKVEQFTREAVEMYGPLQPKDSRLKLFIAEKFKEERQAERDERKKLKEQKKKAKDKILMVESSDG